MWQVLYDELKDQGFEMIAVALDTGGRAAVEGHFHEPDLAMRTEDDVRRLMGWSKDVWKRMASPQYPCLIDEDHLVADLYGMTIVPMAVWIDEDGRIVRPTETAGMTDYFRRMDRETFEVPEEDARALEHNRMVYFNAVRDWVHHGRESIYALSDDEIRRRIRRPSENDARGAAHVKLGRFLFQEGYPEAARRHFDEALRLCPDKWNYRRQRMVLDSELVGELDTSEDLWQAQDALGGRDYHPPIDMPGISGPPPWLQDR